MPHYPKAADANWEIRAEAKDPDRAPHGLVMTRQEPAVPPATFSRKDACRNEAGASAEDRTKTQAVAGDLRAKKKPWS